VLVDWESPWALEDPEAPKRRGPGTWTVLAAVGIALLFLFFLIEIAFLIYFGFPIGI
jgi:hypothetical protein